MNLALSSFGRWGNHGPTNKQYVFRLFFYQSLDATYGGVFEIFLFSKIVFHF